MTEATVTYRVRRVMITVPCGPDSHERAAAAEREMRKARKARKVARRKARKARKVARKENRDRQLSLFGDGK